jgi:hypothetical protein
LFVKSSTSYQTLYGALAALPLFLTWLYICWIIILLGAVIAWRLEQGFPLAKDEDTLDTVNGPLEQMRNEQVQAILPFITMLAIYRHFLDATGKGMTAHALALKLKMPLSWVCDALEGLEALGYVAAVRSEGQSAATVDGGSDTDAFFPAYPPASISVEKMQKDLNSPVENWLLHLHHDLPFDLKKAVNLFTGADRSKYAALSLQEALSRI